jgi:hypothetical protein
MLRKLSAYIQTSNTNKSEAIILRLRIEESKTVLWQVVTQRTPSEEYYCQQVPIARLICKILRLTARLHLRIIVLKCGER